MGYWIERLNLLEIEIINSLNIYRLLSLTILLLIMQLKLPLCAKKESKKITILSSAV